MRDNYTGRAITESSRLTRPLSGYGSSVYQSYGSDFNDDDYIGDYKSLDTNSSAYNSRIMPYSTSSVTNSTARVHRSPGALPYSSYSGVTKDTNDFKEHRNHVDRLQLKDFNLTSTNELLFKGISSNSATKFDGIGDRSVPVLPTRTTHASGAYLTPYELRLSSGRSLPSYKGSTVAPLWSYPDNGRIRLKDPVDAGALNASVGRSDSAAQQYDKVYETSAIKHVL